MTQPLGCLLLHGLGGGPYELGRLPEALREAGFLVNAPVLPGHEGPGPRMPDSRWEDWLATAHRAYEAARDLGRPAGGGAGVLDGRDAGLAAGAGGAVGGAGAAGAILGDPVQRAGAAPAGVVPEAVGAARAAIAAKTARSAGCEDAPVGGGQDRFKTFSLGATVSALELIESVTPRVGEIAVPCLIQQGKLDTVVEPANAAWLHKHLGSERKRLTWYARSDHLLALDRQRSDVESDVLGFLSSLAHPSGQEVKEPLA